MSQEVLNNAETKMREAVTWLTRELGSMRIGRATPALVEDIPVEAYGGKMPLKQVAAISIPEPRVIIIQPWDQTLLPAIERAVSSAPGLGLAPATRENSVYLTIPPLIGERRAELVKIIGQKVEEGRVRVRRIREDAWKNIQDMAQQGVVREDEKFRVKDDLQEVVDTINEEIAELGKRKEEELRID